MKIEIKKISINERMSEETTCFAADLYIDGKKVGICKNAGHGGPTDYQANSKEDREIIAKAEAYCSALPMKKSEEFNFEYEQNLESVIDDLLYDFLKEKEAKQLRKTFEKAFCYGLPNGMSYRMISWKGKTLAQIDKITLQRTYNDIKAKLKAGEVILNNNLQQLGIII